MTVYKWLLIKQTRELEKIRPFQRLDKNEYNLVSIALSQTLEIARKTINDYLQNEKIT